MITRRDFLMRTAAACALSLSRSSAANTRSGPALQFPAEPRQRIAVASYPFREFIAQPDQVSQGKIALKDFAANVVAKFRVNKIEPWTGHFPSTEPAYLEEFRKAVETAHGMIVNIAVDGEHSPYAPNREERELAVAFSKKWIDAAAAMGVHSVRTNIPEAKDSKPNIERAAASLSQVAEYGASRDVVVNLENDNPVSEDPFFLVELIDKVNNPWLHTLPDFGNSLAHIDSDRAYRGVDAMFGKAYDISHVKEMELGDAGKPVRVDLQKTFGILKQHAYKGYLSMEFDSPGDPYAGTAELIAKTMQYLS